MAIKVLIVDDSRFFRKRLAEMIASDPELELAGEAENGRDAVLRTRELKPDLVTMDVEMPVMNGIDAVREIMKVCPTPVLMFSSLTEEGAQATLDALEAGAMDFMPKCFDDILKNKKESVGSLLNRMRELGRSKGSMRRIMQSRTSPATTSRSSTSLGTRTSSQGLSSLGARSSTLGSSYSSRSSLSGSSLNGTSRSSLGGLNSSSSSLRTSTSTSSLRSSTLSSTRTGSTLNSTTSSSLSSSSRLSSLGARPSSTLSSTTSSFGHPDARHHDDRVEEAPKPKVVRNYGAKFSLLAIGSSTGGPVALQTLLTALPGDLPVPVVVIQHMPGSFTGPFAQRLDQLCELKVTEGQDGDVLEPGHVYIAPGGKQMLLEATGSGKTKLHVIPSPAGINYKPCVDISFGSAAQIFKGRVLACILTGMGADGRKACGILHEHGATILAQNEESCVIYGMPKAIVDAGIADHVLPIEELADCMVDELLQH